MQGWRATVLGRLADPLPQAWAGWLSAGLLLGFRLRLSASGFSTGISGGFRLDFGFGLIRFGSGLA